MGKKSGGVTARNTRQGFRSEYIVKYIFSAFGTAVDVSTENDLGIDLLCNLVSFDGPVITFKFSYGIQVKSSGFPFKYSGKQATTWLSKLEFPLILVEVDKPNSKIKVYSTWNLNRYLLDFHSAKEDSYPDEVLFLPSNDEELGTPDSASGVIPIGKPIIEFEFHEIDDSIKCEKFHRILEHWLEIDNTNYTLRRAGVSSAFGYIKWVTNEVPIESGVWYNPHFYSPHHSDGLWKLLAKAIVPLGLYYKKWYERDQTPDQKDTFNDLRIIAVNHLSNKMEQFGKDLFKDNL